MTKKDDGIRYHISVVHLKSFTPGFREPLQKRVVASFDNLDDALDKFIDMSIMEGPDLKNETEEIIDEIMEEPDMLFEQPYSVVFDVLHDLDGKHAYIGPGAYTISGSRLQ